MKNIQLQDNQWARIHAFLIADSNVYVGKDESACRRFVEAVLWISRSGAQWRLMPPEYGN